MRPVMTNVWCDVVERHDGQPASRVAFETTAKCRCDVRYEGGELVIDVYGVDLNAPEGPIGYYDGLVDELELKSAGLGHVQARVRVPPSLQKRISVAPGRGSQFPPRVEAVVKNSLPVRTFIYIDRSPLRNLFSGARITVDAGHGGKDAGFRGPVNLEEKSVALEVCRSLEAVLKSDGAAPVLTRLADKEVSWRERLKRAIGSRAFISVHMGGSADRAERGCATAYLINVPASKALAEAVASEVVKRTKVRHRGVRPMTLEERRAFPPGFRVPSIIVEPVTITNWVDEGLLRNPSVIESIARGISNGIRDFLCYDAGG